MAKLEQSLLTIRLAKNSDIQALVEISEKVYGGDGVNAWSLMPVVIQVWFSKCSFLSTTRCCL